MYKKKQEVFIKMKKKTRARESIEYLYEQFIGLGNAYDKVCDRSYII